MSLLLCAGPAMQTTWQARYEIAQCRSTCSGLLRRVAALYLVERIKGEVAAIAATHFQALAVGQARQRAIRRLARNPPGFQKSISVRCLPLCPQ